MPITYHKREIKLLGNVAPGKVKLKNNFVCNLRNCKMMGLYYLDSSSKEGMDTQVQETLPPQCFRATICNV